MKVLVLSMKPYKIENDEGDIRGTSLWYVNLEESNTEGSTPMKVSISEESDFYCQTYGTYPAVANLEYGMVSGKGNKPSLKLVNFQRLDSVNLVELLA